MRRAPAATLSCLVVLLGCSSVRAEDEPAPDEKLDVREIRLVHVDVKEANAVLRSILNVRKLAADERRQVLVLRDTPARLDEAEALLAGIDQPAQPWSVVIAAVFAEGGEIVLREASPVSGRIELQYGSEAAVGEDALGLSVAVARASSDELEVEWGATLRMPERWIESARAKEALHHEDTVTLLSTSLKERQAALAQLLGVPGEVARVVVRVRRSDGRPRPSTRR